MTLDLAAPSTPLPPPLHTHTHTQYYWYTHNTMHIHVRSTRDMPGAGDKATDNIIKF